MIDIKKLDGVLKNVKPSSKPRTIYKYFGVHGDEIAFTLTYKPKRGQPITEVWTLRFDEEYGYFLSPRDNNYDEEFVEDADADIKKIAVSFKTAVSELIAKTSKTYTSMYDESKNVRMAIRKEIKTILELGK